MKEVIIETLKKLETEKNIRILYACESGSRAWGFHSPGSDYDVRFVYVHPTDWYLGIEDKQDFIELPKDEVLDITGYELRKLLKLFRSSNAKIYEWLQSPVTYLRDDRFLNEMRHLMNVYYSSRAGIHHYLGLTGNTVETFLQGEQVKLKKYFYALRPILAALWIVEFDKVPPMEFDHLRQLIKDEQISRSIDRLLRQKLRVDEGYLIRRDKVIDDFILKVMLHCEDHAQHLSKKETDTHSLNLLFRKMIGVQ